MKKFISLLALATALVASPAMAADIDAPPPPTDDLRPASYDWSGIYVGAAVGATCIDGSANLVDPAIPLNATYALKGCGGHLAGLAGMNFQMDHVVFGIEADIGTSTDLAEDKDNIALGYKYKTSIRARAGYAIDNILLYGTAGYAYAGGNVGVWEAIPLPAKYEYSSKAHHGWTAGAGMEYAVTDAWRVRGEYMYTSLSSSDKYNLCGTCTGSIDYGNMHEFRIGAIYAFDWH